LRASVLAALSEQTLGPRAAVLVLGPFRYFNSSPEVIRLVVMMYVRYPLSLRNVEDLLVERGIEISHETVRFWWNRFGPIFAAEIRKRRVAHMRSYPQSRWHLDEVFVKVNGKLFYLWRAVDHEGEVLDAVITSKRDKAAALRRRERAMQRFRSLKTLQKFSSVHAQVHNQFNHERHLVPRQIYKQRRSAALAEWHALAA
jgi:putative transposase